MRNQKSEIQIPIFAPMSKTIVPYHPGSGTKKEQVADMFNNISKTYDFLNHFLSLGIDIIWRKQAINELKKDQPQLILDVATGTGDFAFEALSILKPKKIIGVDISQGMLDIAQQKITKRNLSDKFEVKLGDSEKLPFDNNQFDAVTVAYGVRNFENLEVGLADIQRVLKPGGILIMSSPEKTGEVSFNEFHVKELSRTEFADLIGAHFKFSRFYSQKIVFGSLVAPISPAPGQPFEYESGGFEQIDVYSEIPTHVFNLCIASDGPDAGLPVSFFDGQDILLGNILKPYLNSRLYRLSNSIKKLFNR